MYVLTCLTFILPHCFYYIVILFELWTIYWILTFWLVTKNSQRPRIELIVLIEFSLREIYHVPFYIKQILKMQFFIKSGIANSSVKYFILDKTLTKIFRVTKYFYIPVKYDRVANCKQFLKLIYLAWKIKFLVYRFANWFFRIN